MSKKITLVTLLFFLVFSCKRKEDTRWDVDILSPVVKTTLTIEDLIADSALTINPDHSVDLDYSFSFSPIEDQFFLTIPDTLLETKYGFPFLSAISLSPGFQFVNDPAENEFNLGDAKIEYMEVQSGELSYKITSHITEKTFYTYTIFRTDDGNGNEFTKTISVPAARSRSNPATVQGSFRFDGYSFDLTGASGTKFNTFESRVTVSVDPSGSAVLVSNLDSVFIENKLLSLKPAYVRGYIGQSSFVEGPTANKFSVFKPIVSGTLDIDSVNIYTELKNYIGAEAQIKLNQLISTNTSTGSNVNLTHSSIGSLINLNRAIDNAGVVTPSIYRINYTKANSNIDLVIENLADIMTTQVEANLNPLGNISSGNDFLYFDKVIDADFHINLPLKFIAKDLKLRQTIDLNVTEENNPVNNALVTIYAKNGFPFDAEVQLYLLNTSGSIVDSVMVTGLINSATTDANNDVVNPVNSVIKAAIPKEKMEILNKNSQVILQLIFNTNSAPHTTLYSHNFMDLKLVTDMNMEINYR